MIETNVQKLDTTLYNAFWSKLQQLRFDLFYYDEYFKECVVVSRYIKYGIIVATTLATGAWMNWHDIKGVCVFCAIAIWLLQGISALSEWLLFENRKLELRELSIELEQLYINMETDWRRIQALEVSNEEIRSLIQTYALRQVDISKHYFKDDALPINDRIWAKADDLTESYFEFFV